MTDEELIAQLRAKKQKGNRFDSLEYEAADRLEALKAEVARLDAGWQSENVAALTNAWVPGERMTLSEVLALIAAKGI